ncbi:hypothetical protein NIES4075_40350 [Tolypothrix sp. NIES-4075]|uniref:hypothetical protein n=1 Tax=Tolypothrix sp. NIES-4075 TaxID=2005459 RepID=UPI000B74A9AD|nr:hypothetical protein [Tolypothrix sp. NIES-4075]GAX43025.1 hypothetical protein NIES4075_40350 [Tolypothrix sp. NIES-4075]
MAISLFSGDATRTDSYVDASVQISGYHITEEIYSGVESCFILTNLPLSLNNLRKHLDATHRNLQAVVC